MSYIWRRQWQATPVLLPRKSHGWRSLVGYSPWGRHESAVTERLHFHFSLSCNGEGNGNPLQYFLPGKSHGQRSLAGYSPWGHKESDMTDHAYTAPCYTLSTMYKTFKVLVLIFLTYLNNSFCNETWIWSHFCFIKTTVERLELWFRKTQIHDWKSPHGCYLYNIKLCIWLYNIFTVF